MIIFACGCQALRHGFNAWPKCQATITFFDKPGGRHAADHRQRKKQFCFHFACKNESRWRSFAFC